MSLRRFRWWAVLVPVLVALVAVGLGIPALGAALVVTDALQPSDAIFVLDGGTPVRELEAASLYRLGYAPRVVVARGRDAISVARQVSGEPSRQERAVRVLVHVGVPEAAVVTLSQEVDVTAYDGGDDPRGARDRPLHARQPAADVRPEVLISTRRRPSSCTYRCARYRRPSGSARRPRPWRRAGLSSKPGPSWRSDSSR